MIVADVKRDMRQRSWSDEKLNSEKSRINEFERISVGTFGEYCDSILCTLKYQLVYHILEDIKTLRNLSGLERSPYEHFNIHIKQTYVRISQRIHTQMMKTVNFMERNWEGALPYGK